MFKVFTPPTRPSSHWLSLTSVFLGGSIEMGKAVEWQQEAIKKLEDSGEDCVVFNPRREDWDSSWEQSIDNPQFNKQVTWELDMLDEADFVLFYFDPATKSPITLMELGLHVGTNPIVVCPPGFWRKGNVDILCERHDVKVYETLDEAMKVLIEKIKIINNF